MQTVRYPVVAGTFYYADEEHLREHLKELFPPKERPRYRAIVSPHAGYEYSGRTAAKAVSSLRKAGTFIIIGPNHNLIGPEFSVMGYGRWVTPLGEIEINEELAKELKHNKIIEEDSIAHEHEHSVEVQLPFLQYRFGDFKIVPMSVSNTSYSETFFERCESVGETIASAMKNGNVGLIASSDFSHYIPFDKAKRMDSEAIERIEKLDTRGFFKTLEKNNASICGYAPIAIAMSAMKCLGCRKAEKIEYTSSGEATKDYGSVVAYAAIGFR